MNKRFTKEKKKNEMSGRAHLNLYRIDEDQIETRYNAQGEKEGTRIGVIVETNSSGWINIKIAHQLKVKGDPSQGSTKLGTGASFPEYVEDFKKDGFSIYSGVLWLSAINWDCIPQDGKVGVFVDINTDPTREKLMRLRQITPKGFKSEKIASLKSRTDKLEALKSLLNGEES